MKKVCL